MPTWLAIVVAALKAIGLVSAAERLIERWMAREQGRAAQQTDDLKATNEQDRKAQEIDQDVRALPDSDLDQRLRGTPPGQ